MHITVTVPHLTFRPGLTAGLNVLSVMQFQHSERIVNLHKNTYIPKYLQRELEIQLKNLKFSATKKAEIPKGCKVIRLK